LRTPLHMAATYNDVSVVKQLLRFGAQVDSRALHGWTPLLKAVLLSNHDNVQALLDAGADPNAAVENGFSVMQCALAYSDERMGLLLLRAGAYVEEGESRFDDFEQLKETLLAAGLITDEDLERLPAFAKTIQQRQQRNESSDQSEADAATWLEFGDD